MWHTFLQVNPMRKYLFLFAISIFVTPAFGQNNSLKFGIKAGLDIAKIVIRPPLTGRTIYTMNTEQTWSLGMCRLRMNWI